MFSLVKKEISSFFGSLTGYLVVVVFLLINGMFLWVFPGNYNILENKYASLDGLFSLAPWIYLFLVPAVTMRLFAEEKRLGTIELLFTRPLSSLQIVLAKYIAGILLIFFCLLPTIIYFYSVYQLGSPVGNIDVGGTIGSYLGLFFLAAIYVAIGLLASSLTDNQIFAFILATVLSFIAYIGFDFIASLPESTILQKIVIDLGINEHYASISRGVIDSRDLVYFLVSISLIIAITQFVIANSKFNKSVIKKIGTYFVLVLLLLIFSANYFFRIDLTAERKYSLAEISKEIVLDIKQPVSIDLFLAGEDLHPGFQRFQKEIKEKINDYNAYSNRLISLRIIDPYELENAKDRDQLFSNLVERGIQPVNLQVKTDKGLSNKYIFPAAIIKIGDKEKVVNLLKNDPVLSGEQNLNNSIESLEYEFTSALNSLILDDRKTVGFLTGQGELSELETQDIRQSLAELYDVEFVTTDQFSSNSPDVLIIADPTNSFQEKEKFEIDQYIMNGGRLMWLIDPIQVSLDSLRKGQTTLAFPKNLNLDDQLFRYGVRLNADLVQDVECLMIPVNVAPLGAKSNFKPFPWYYSPLLYPAQNQVIGKNIRQIKAEFVSSIDTLENKSVRKKILLRTSSNTRVLQAPLEVNLASVNNPPDRKLFNHLSVPVGVLLEGEFNTIFKNRMIRNISGTNSELIEKSPYTKMIVIADGNIIANQYSLRTGKPEISPLGYDRYSQQTFGNKEFLINAVNYLCDDSGLMALKSRVFKIRMLDKTKIQGNGKLIGWANVLIPIVFVVLLGLLFYYRRIRVYKR